MNAYLDAGPQMLAYLEQNSEVRLAASTIPDYAPGAPGWKTGRCLLTADYDGAKLGAYFAKLRPPIPEMGLFHSMQMSPTDALKTADASINKALATARNMTTDTIGMMARLANRLSGETR